MKNTRTRKRSTSEKRKRSTSRSKDDDLLIKALNQKVASDKQVLISKDQYDEFQSMRRQFKEAQARAISSETELARLQEENTRLEMWKNQYLNREKSPNDSLQNSLMASYPDNQRVLDNLKSSFSDIDQVLRVKSRAGRKYMGYALKIVKEVEASLEQIPMSQKVKAKIMENISDLSRSIDNVIRIFTRHDTETEADPASENIKLRKEVVFLKEKLESYKETLQRLQDQTKSLKRRLLEVEHGGTQKKTLVEQEGRIDFLEQEKELLSQHVRSLQSTLTEQCQIIVHIKEAFQALQLSKTEATSPTPKRTKDFSLLLSRNSQEDYLQDEIESLDLEIHQLQQSLQKALTSN